MKYPHGAVALLRREIDVRRARIKKLEQEIAALELGLHILGAWRKEQRLSVLPGLVLNIGYP